VASKVTTPVQNFDLYDLGGSTAADMYDDEGGVNLSISSGDLTGVISQILDDNKEAIIAMDLTRADHREYLAGTISHAMLDRSDVRVITPNNTSEDK
jgi:hypothetical protein|tara:strand:- start:1555 stop:1845 length:291 start_codon:yes stop_codon:yes gene_type:complete